MKTRTQELWTIEELSARVALALEHGYAGVSSGRVRDVPDLRTIRYYTTLGLLDRPAEMRGRTALYRHRHLLQLVAIKRLQARGLSLAQVQARAFGLTDAALARIARAPAPEGVAAPSAAGGRAESFWRAAAAPLAEPAAGRAGSSIAHRAEDVRGRNQAIPLAEGLLLAVAARRGLSDEDLRVIRMAAAPLIEILRLRGLIGIGPDNQGDIP
jgi:hypothetical protein